MNNAKTGKLNLLKAKRLREAEHFVVLGNAAVEKYAQARRLRDAAVDELRLARRRMEPDETMAELQALVDEAQQRVDDTEPAAKDGVGVLAVKIRAMAPLAYQALKAEFPPTDADDHEVRIDTGNDKAKAAWNQSEFAPRLVATCVIDPELDLADVRGFREAWGDPDWNRLVRACINVHEQGVDTSSLVFSSGRTRS